jgi:hypothetical protein
VHERLLDPVSDSPISRVTGHSLYMLAVMLRLVSLSNRAHELSYETKYPLTPPHEGSIANVVHCLMCTRVLLVCKKSASVLLEHKNRAGHNLVACFSIESPFLDRIIRSYCSLVSADFCCSPRLVVHVSKRHPYTAPQYCRNVRYAFLSSRLGRHPHAATALMQKIGSVSRRLGLGSHSLSGVLIALTFLL